MAYIGTWEWAAMWATSGAKSNVYTYYFTKTPAKDESGGVYYSAELWYTFNNIPYFDYSNANFIRTGDPNGGSLPYFPPSTAANKTTIWLGEWCGASIISGSTERFSFLRKWMSHLHEY
ncbi:Carboxylic ester hydrolase [Penicillium tannophilum]|nr:Carboxylic ester hydrolase [Penicillium tannophilum]